MDRPVALAIGDPIFFFDGDGEPVQVGEVTHVADTTGRGDRRFVMAASGEALLYPQAPPLADEAILEYYATPQSLDWVVQTMLPPEKRRLIAQELSAAFEAHREEILTALRPVVEEGFREAIAVVEDDLPHVIERHRPELEKLGAKYRGEVIEKRLQPLVRQEIWPLVQRRAEPLADEIGQEVWQRASVWRFGWRYAYDVSPLPQQNLVEKEWKRFLRDEAIPAIEGHTDDIIRVQQQILTDIARSERVRRVVRDSLVAVIDDPQVQRVAWSIFREAVLENPKLRETLERRWRSEEAQRALSIAAERLEPAVRRVGDMIFGNRETGVSPEFARVLRNQILGKDRRWLVLMTELVRGNMTSTKSEPKALRIQLGRDEPVNPFVRMDAPFEMKREAGKGS
jgi:hypothetical protein